MKLLIPKYLWLFTFFSILTVGQTSQTLALTTPVDVVATPKLVDAGAPKRVLFIGNSFSFYNAGIHNHLGSLVRSAGDWQAGKNRLRLATLSGGYIREHLVNIQYLLEQPNSNWDAVVLQGHSSEPISDKKIESFQSSTAQAVKLIREKDLTPILFMTWAYKDKPQMTAALAQGYIKMANQLDALVVPVGLAFAQAQTELPSIELYVPDVLGVETNESGDTALTYRKDWKHPSAAGTYLAACVFYASLYHKSPQGLTFHAGLSPETALALQKLSWQVTSGFYARQSE